MPNPFSAWVIREKDETATEFSTPVEVHVPSTPVAYDILNDPLDAESEEEASVNAVIDATPILEAGAGEDVPELSPSCYGRSASTSRKTCRAFRRSPSVTVSPT